MNKTTDELTKILTGKTYAYTYTSGMSVSLSFTEDKANWEITAGPAEGISGSDDYSGQSHQNYYPNTTLAR